MMRKLILSLLCLCFAFLGEAQTWSMLGQARTHQATAEIKTVVCDSKGNVYSAGDFNNSGWGGNGGNFVNKWDGNIWSELGGVNSLGANNTIYKLYCDINDNVYAAGKFTNLLGSCFVAKWDGNSWQELGGLNSLAANNTILSLCGDKFGNIYASGYFKNVNNKYYVAKWDGVQWTEVGGTNSLSANNTISALCCDSQGNLYAAGLFTNNSGNAYIAKWDGNVWSELGGVDSLAAQSSNGKSSNINAICVDNQNNLYAVGGFYSHITNSLFVAKFNGQNWSELYGLNHLQNPASMHSVCADKFGNIYVEGNIKNNLNNYYVQQFNGIVWQELGGFNALMAAYGIGNNTGLNSVCSDKLGNVYVAFGVLWWYVFKYGNSSPTLFLSSIENDLLLMHPNPTTSELLISSPSNQAFKISSITGQVLMEGKLQPGTQSIDVSAFPNGIYFLQTATETYKFCVAH